MKTSILALIIVIHNFVCFEGYRISGNYQKYSSLLMVGKSKCVESSSTESKLPKWLTQSRSPPIWLLSEDLPAWFINEGRETLLSIFLTINFLQNF
jgi:hypothetical protein